MRALIEFFNTDAGREIAALLMSAAKVLGGVFLGYLRLRFQALFAAAMDAAEGKPAQEIAAANFVTIERATQFETAVKRDYAAAVEDGVPLTADYAKKLAKDLAVAALLKKATKKLKLKL